MNFNFAWYLRALFALASGVALALAFQTPQNKSKTAAEPSAAPAPPTVPDTIRNAEEKHSDRSALKEAAKPEPVARAATADDGAWRAQRELDQKARGSSIFFESAGGNSDRGLPEMSSRAEPAGAHRVKFSRLQDVRFAVVVNRHASVEHQKRYRTQVGGSQKSRCAVLTPSSSWRC